MVQIKSEKYTPLLKAYLTYARTPEIAATLLKERHDVRYLVKISGVTVSEHRVTKPLWDAIKQKGGQVSQDKQRNYEGRNKIFGVPVTIRSFTEPNKKTEHIRVRVTAEHAMGLFEKIKIIKDGLEKWGVKPALCVWEKYTELQTVIEHEVNIKDMVQNNIVEQDHKRLETLIESLQVDVAELKERPIKKAMLDDREVMKGILK